MEPRPLSEIVGNSKEYELSVDCLTKSLNFAGARWVADPSSLRDWLRIEQHYEQGRIELTSETQARYREPDGSELILNRTDDPSIPACP